MNNISKELDALEFIDDRALTVAEAHIMVKQAQKDFDTVYEVINSLPFGSKERSGAELVREALRNNIRQAKSDAMERANGYDLYLEYVENRNYSKHSYNDTSYVEIEQERDMRLQAEYDNQFPDGSSPY